MGKISISVADAARNFADCVNRALYQNVTFILLKNGSPVARLVPDSDKICTGRDLTEAPERTELPAARPDQPFEVAAVTVAELWHGVERATGAHRAKRRQYLQTIVASLPVIPHTVETAYEHARIRVELESSGKMIGYYDIIVAATALERGSEVATSNLQHFVQVKGLAVIEPKMIRHL